MLDRFPIEIYVTIVKLLDGVSRQQLSFCNVHLRTIVVSEHTRLIKFEYLRIINFLASIETPCVGRFIADAHLAWEIQEESVDAHFSILLSALELIPHTHFLRLLLHLVIEFPSDVNLYLSFVYSIITETEHSDDWPSPSCSSLINCITFLQPSFVKHNYSSKIEFLLSAIHPTFQSETFSAKMKSLNEKNAVIQMINLLLLEHNNHLNATAIEVFHEKLPDCKFYGVHRDLIGHNKMELCRVMEENLSVVDNELKNEYNVIYPTEILKKLPYFLQEYLFDYHSLEILQLFDMTTLTDRSEFADHPHYFVFPVGYMRTYFKGVKIQLKKPYSRLYEEGVFKIMCQKRLDQFYSIYNKNIKDPYVFLKIASMDNKKWEQIQILSQTFIWKTTLDFFDTKSYKLVLCLSHWDKITEKRLKSIISLGHIYFFGLNNVKWDCLENLFQVKSSRYQQLKHKFNQLISKDVDKQTFNQLFIDINESR